MTGKTSGSGETFNFLHLLFTALAGICFLGAIGVLLYEVWGLLSGAGWQQIKISDGLFASFGRMPMPWQLDTLLKILPLDISLMGLAWILSKISDRFESLS